MTLRAVRTRVMWGALLGVAAGVAWLTLFVGPFQGAIFGLLLWGPVTGSAGAVCGLVTAGIDGRRAIRACAIGAIIATALVLTWVGVRREERHNLIGQRVWRFPGQEATVLSAIGFNAQYNLPIPAGAGAIVGALIARHVFQSRRRP